MTMTMTTTGVTTMTDQEADGATSARRREPRGMPLRLRIVGSIALLSAIALLVAGAAALLVERERIEARAEVGLAQEIREFSIFGQEGVDPETGEPFTDADRLITVWVGRNIPDENQSLVGFTQDATVVPQDATGGLHRDTAFRQIAAAATRPGFHAYESADDGSIVYAVMPVAQGDVRRHLVAAYFLDREYAELDDTIRSYAVAATLAWVFLVLGAWLLAGRIIEPVDNLRRTAVRITDHDVTERIDVTGHDEIADLGRQFNAMLDRIQEALGTQRRMLDDAGHELRTPITVIRGHLEVMDVENPADVLETRELAIDELDRMGRLVHDLLMLAKAKRPDFVDRKPTDLSALMTDAFAKATALADREWSLDTGPEAQLQLDEQRVTQALLQLASNAVKATRLGDPITMGWSVTLTHALLWVGDSGAGVADEDRERIFTRFVSGHTRTGGTGLGLPIVRAIAEAHEGSAWVTDAYPDGHGALFVIELPHDGDAIMAAGQDATLDDLFGPEPTVEIPQHPTVELTQEDDRDQGHRGRR